MKTFFVGVKGLIVSDGKVLLVHGEHTGRDFWDAPGGRIDDDEDLMQTLDRELHEELPNIQSYSVKKLIHAHRIHKDITNDISLMLVFYQVEDALFDGEPRISEEHSRLAWLPIAEAREVAALSVQAALSQL